MTITVYSRPANECRACWSTEKRMEKHGVKHKKVLLDDESSAVVAGFGYTSAPVVVVTDDSNTVTDHWGGYREEKIREYRPLG